MATPNMDRNQSLGNAEKTIDRIDGTIRSAVDAVKCESGKYYDEAKHMAEAGKHMAQDTYKDVEDAVKTQSDMITDYVKAQPMKSLLIALGAGYLLSCMSKK